MWYDLREVECNGLKVWCSYLFGMLSQKRLCWVFRRRRFKSLNIRVPVRRDCNCENGDTVALINSFSKCAKYLLSAYVVIGRDAGRRFVLIVKTCFWYRDMVWLGLLV